LIEYRKVDKWDGKVPQVNGGNTPFINLSNTTNTPPIPPAGK